MTFVKNKEFTNVRKWIVNNLDNDSTRILEQYMIHYMKQLNYSTIPHACCKTNDYQYKSNVCC